VRTWLSAVDLRRPENRRSGEGKPTEFEDVEDSPIHDFPLQKHVAIDVKLVNQSQILINGLDAQRPGVADGFELDLSTFEIDLPAAWLVKPSKNLQQRRLASRRRYCPAAPELRLSETN
jgi:hypothetical protein